MKKLLSVLLAAMMLLMALGGCSSSKDADDKRISISMYLWDRSMIKELTPWLEQKFPDIDFTFVQSFNTIEYYKDLLKRGEELPDIITCRRFSLNDAAPLANHLLDLSQSEVAGTFYSSYLEQNRETSGAIRWLPMCAEVDSIVANKDLFDQYGLALPTNYAEFVAAIDFFESKGIKGFQTDWNYDYSCLETLQGNAISDLMSLEGTMWRMAYESETEEEQVGLDDVVWPRVFEKYEQFLKDVHFKKGDEELQYAKVFNPYVEGKIAMMRNTAALADTLTSDQGIKSVILPWFGETKEDNWLLTYPMCQLSVNKNVKEDEAKYNAIMEVLMAIFSEEGQKHVAAGTSVLSYNKEVNITSSDALEYSKEYIDSNHLYIRLASTEIFSVSKDVCIKMMTGEYDAKEAYEEFNRQITDFKDPDSKEVLFTQETAYSNVFTDQNSKTTSSLVNTLAAAFDDEVVIAYSPTVSTSIFVGDYTMQQTKWVLTARNSIYRGEYTGAEIYRFMDWLVNVKEDGHNPIKHRNIMPVTSGISYTVTEYEKGKFKLEDVTYNGQPLDDNAVYDVLLVGADTFIEHELFCGCPMPQDLKEKREDYLVNDYSSQECMALALSKTKQFLAPSDYLTILH